MLRAQNIGYKAGGKYLLNDCSVDIEPGILHLVIGPNGAGKSTLIKLLSGQLPAHTGQVWYNDKPVTSYSIPGLARIRAVLSQNLELSFPLKVWEVVMMGRYAHFTGRPGHKDSHACEAAMSLFNISNMAGRDYTTLSGGEKQRVHFARVMSQVWYSVPGQYRYLLLDEPLTFLDVNYQYQFMQQITGLLSTKDLVVIGVVHDLNLASKFADKIIFLNEGRILAAGSPDEVMTKANIKIAYGMEPDIMTHDNRKHLLF